MTRTLFVPMTRPNSQQTYLSKLTANSFVLLPSLVSRGGGSLKFFHSFEAVAGGSTALAHMNATLGLDFFLITCRDCAFMRRELD